MGVLRADRRQFLWNAIPWLTALGVLLLWQALAELDTRYLPERDVPPPTRIVHALASQARTDRFWSAVEQTLKGWSVGLALAFAVAMPLGIALGLSRPAFRGVRSLVELLRPIPGVTLLPLLVLLVGLGFELKLILVAVGAFWPLFLQSVYGVRNVEPVALEMARAYRVGPLSRFWRVVVPSAAPYVATGLRISATVALEVAIAVELLVGGKGIGTELGATSSSDRIPTMYAYVLTASLLGMVINVGARRLERRLLHWHPSQRIVAAV
jgi:ABC-type nitrate/sulfonate/bicarbonate transport system permease component